MRSLEGYQLCRGLIEYLILLMCDINQSVSHYIFGIAKCTTIRLGDVFHRFISIEEKGTHLSNLGQRRQTRWKFICDQIVHCDESVRHTE